jgi:hypothetical protein
VIKIEISVASAAPGTLSQRIRIVTVATIRLNGRMLMGCKLAWDAFINGWDLSATNGAMGSFVFFAYPLVQAGNASGTYIGTFNMTSQGFSTSQIILRGGGFESGDETVGGGINYGVEKTSPG